MDISANCTHNGVECAYHGFGHDLCSPGLPPFEEFPKMARLNRECYITEKIDGTNAQIYILQDFKTMFVGSRSRWINPSDDNYGFAKWCAINYEDLLKLGPGKHFGEWWGSGCQRGYGLKNGEKRFSLFNVDRWGDENVRPKCCSVVPLLYAGYFSTNAVEGALDLLRTQGSHASPGFMNPEGVVIYHTAARSSFKVTLKNDAQPKSVVKDNGGSVA